jgi:hypothetical protein
MITIPSFSQDVITEQNYQKIIEKYNVVDATLYKKGLPGFEECRWDDLTLLNQYGNLRTGMPLYGMGNFGWGNEITGKSAKVRELGFVAIRAMFAEDDIFEKTAKAGINCVLLLGGPYYKEGDIEGWKQSIEYAVKRYGKNGAFWKEHPDIEPNPVKCYEILGETNIDSFTPPQGVDPVKHYYEYLKAAYTVIKSLDPDAKIIAFGTAGGNIGTWFGISHYAKFEHEYKPEKSMTFYGWLRFIDEVNRFGGYQYYDVIGVDNYSQPYGPDYKGNVVKAILVLRERMKEYGIEQKPIWFTEVGYPMEYRKQKYEYDEQKQADFTLRLYGLAASHGIERIHSFHVVDFVQNGDDPSMIRKFGFFDVNGNVKKQGLAMQTMISVLPEPYLLKTISDGIDDYYAYVFSGVNDKEVIMLWTANEETYIADDGIRKYVKPEVKVEKIVPVAGKKATMIDMYGNKMPLSIKNNQVSVEIGPSPLFILCE